jgi:hypothetical protein
MKAMGVSVRELLLRDMVMNILAEFATCLACGDRQGALCWGLHVTALDDP